MAVVPHAGPSPLQVAAAMAGAIAARAGNEVLARVGRAVGGYASDRSVDFAKGASEFIRRTTSRKRAADSYPAQPRNVRSRGGDTYVYAYPASRRNRRRRFRRRYRRRF